MVISISNAVAPAPEDATISPFRVEAPQEEIDEPRRRKQATRWLGKETVADQSLGVQTATIQEGALLRHRLSSPECRDNVVDPIKLKCLRANQAEAAQPIDTGSEAGI